jgi:ketosteroid isomerase-like protein
LKVKQETANSVKSKVLISAGCFSFAAEINNMEKTILQTDSSRLSALNSQFIKNFLDQDASAHSEIIHPDFICIESNGTIVSRETYLKNWATDLDNSGYTSFTYQDERIRVFGKMALVIAKTVYTREENGRVKEGYTIYTDTYIKDNDDWRCVQVQITPVL